MAVVNNLRKQVDLPVWEWCRFNPIGNTAAGYTLTTGDSLTDRYIYFTSTTTMFRYDTWSDSWQQLATPPTAAVTCASTRYTTFGGNWGRVLGATSTTVTLPGLGKGLYTGSSVRIYSGTGAGQTATISAVADSVIWDQGVVTTVTAAIITDTAKKWNFNQWQGYYVHIEYNSQGATGGIQYRKVLYNDATNLYLSDTNYQAIDPWNNTGFSNAAPYATPIATAGSQAFYSITSQVCTVPTWTTTPDTTSRYQVLSGAIWMFSSNASTPFYSLQLYDVLTDTWFARTAVTGMFAAALAGDVCLERTGEAGGTFLTGTATSGAARTLTDTTQTLVQDRYAHYQLTITGGTGAGQRRLIIASGTNYFEVERAWDVNPDATSTYTIYADRDKFFLSGNNQASMYGYSIQNDILYQGKMYEYGLARQMAIRLGSATNYSYEAIALTSAVRNTGGVTAIAPSPAAGGTGYLIGDILTFATTGTIGKAIVTQTLAGVVTAVLLISAGLGYSTGTTTTTGGTGTSCTITISSVGTVGRLTTALNHFFKVGDSINFSGAVEAAWNTTYTVLGVDGITTLDITTTAVGTAVVANSLSTTVLVDSTKNWTTNEHVGKLVSNYTVGLNGTVTARRITANTATTITMAALGGAPINGTGRYIISDIIAPGRDRQYKQQALLNQGYASSGSTTTLVDSTKSWLPSQWLNYKVRITAGTGFGNELTITASNATTLTYTTQSFTPDATSKYIVMDTFGIATSGSTTTLVDTTKAWTVNQWAGKRVRLTSGTFQMQELLITSNTATALTFALTTAPDATTTYQILSIAARGVGVELEWCFGTSETTTRGKYMLAPRGGGFTGFDRYDLTTETFEYGYMVQPQSEPLSTGTMYTYDGVDTIYFTNNATSRVFAYNVTQNKVNAYGMVPYGMGAAVLDNRMEIIQTVDGLKYLYIMRHSGQEMWRTLLFF
jgi:hypothetical protein